MRRVMKAESPAKSRTATKKKTAKKSSTAVSEAQRDRMIAEAAYKRAAERGFEDGSAEEDWLLAEQEIDAQLGIETHE